MPASPARRIGVLAYDGCFGAEIFGLTDVLLIANRVATADGAAPPFEVSVVATRAGVVRTAGGVTVSAERWHRRVDDLIVPGFELLPTDDVDERLAAAPGAPGIVADLAGRGVNVGSVCVGAFLLGEAGVLDHRRATTSWLFASALAARHPAAVVTPEAMLVTDGPVTTAAAFSAVHDLAMMLVRRHAGDRVARRTSRITLIPDNRTSQAPFVDRSAGPDDAAFAADVVGWLGDRLADPYDLGRLAAAFHVSTRTLLRRMAAETGRSPLDHLQDLRVDAAKRLLESTDLPTADVMRRVGYADPGTFRRLFAGRVGVTPAAYRRQFRQQVRL